jgi:hypothetical protein
VGEYWKMTTDKVPVFSMKGAPRWRWCFRIDGCLLRGPIIPVVVVVEVAEAEAAAVEAGAGEGFGASPEAASLDAIFSSKKLMFRALRVSRRYLLLFGRSCRVSCVGK